MSTYQQLVTDAVRRYMAEASASQSLIAKVIETDQPAVSRRLSGRQAWSLDDVETLHFVLGIEFPLPAFHCCSEPESVPA